VERKIQWRFRSSVNNIERGPELPIAKPSALPVGKRCAGRQKLTGSHSFVYSSFSASRIEMGRLDLAGQNNSTEDHGPNNGILFAEFNGPVAITPKREVHPTACRNNLYLFARQIFR
jgi:hypothetical protein